MVRRGMSEEIPIPSAIPNLIGGKPCEAAERATFDKIDPHSGEVLWTAARSSQPDVDAAVAVAARSQPAWAATPGVHRGLVLHELVKAMQAHRDEIAATVARETGKSPKDAAGETDGAIALGLFFASEGQRLYGRTTTSGTPHKNAMTVRRPVGVAGLIVAANTPIANACWKVFPALVCGNAAVLKAAEDTPATAWLVGKLATASGLPDGVLSIVQGLGEEAGAALVAHPQVDLISFTGSTEVGRAIQRVAGERLARVSLELGGKNPMVVCDDADLDNAVRWAALSAFSNAGQRCAAASRMLIFDAVYDEFRERLVRHTSSLRLGPTDDDDLGPVINASQLEQMLGHVERAQQAGATVLTGGHRLTGPAHEAGFYMAPTIVEAVATDAEISHVELFGPITVLYRVRDFDHAVALANDSPYGLTACIHTRSVDRAQLFCERIRSGVVVVNAGTYGSEPHMPFGGLRQSGNGWREPGTEAVDVYTELQDIYVYADPERI
jgi:acyl-CoA reductase-like NAD-dependent aldehyde dehydrogenase